MNFGTFQNKIITFIGEEMKKDNIIAAVGVLFLGVFAGIPFESSASSLPAAGAGLVFNEGKSVDVIAGEHSSAVTQALIGVTETVKKPSAGADTEKKEIVVKLPEGYMVPASNNAVTVSDDETDEPEEWEIADEDEERDEDLGKIAVAQVQSFVNIRSGPGTDTEVLGKLYNNAVGEIIAKEGDWIKISSGTVTGYVNSEYVVYGPDAEELIDSIMKKKATVRAASLNFRKEASTSSEVITKLPKNAVYEVVDTDTDGWVKINVNGKEGYVSAEYVTVASSFIEAESKEEEEERLAAEAEQKRLEKEAEEAAKKAAEEAAAKKAAEDAARVQAEAEAAAAQAAADAEAQQAALIAAQQQIADAGLPDDGTQTGELGAVTPEVTETPALAEAETVPEVTAPDLGQQVADFALQFVGNPYVYGGSSLTNGADCSGFVLAVYKNFGVKLPHSATADQKMGTAVPSLDEAKPGDLMCYSGHVGIYIGNGKFVHASTPKTGIKIGDVNYKKILAIRRIFD